MYAGTSLPYVKADTRGAVAAKRARNVGVLILAVGVYVGKLPELGVVIH